MSLKTLLKGRLLILLAPFFISTVTQLQAAVMMDSRSSGGAADNVGLSSLTWSHTINSGSNRALFVGVATATTTLPTSLPTSRVLSVTYNGVALTRIGTVVSTNSLNSSELFALTNPPIGTASVVVTFTTTIAMIPSPFVNQAVGNSISFFDVSQTTPNSALFPAAGTDRFPAVDVTGSVAGDFVFDNLAASPTALFFVEGANQTVCSDVMVETTCTRGRRFFGSYDIGAASTEPGASPLVTMSWTMTNPDNWALGAIVVRQFVSTAASVTISGRVTIPSGKGLARTRVTLTDSNGETRTALTNNFGFYRFADVAAGETYIFNVVSPFYTFSPQSITVNEDTADLNFVAEQ